MDGSLWEALANRWISVRSEKDREAIGSFINKVSMEADNYSGARSMIEELAGNFAEDDIDAN